MADISILVPGVMGSNLRMKRPILDEKLWLIAPAILTDAVGKLTLAADGDAMGDGSGRTVYASDLFQYYYGQLQVRLRREGFESFGFPYDWRKDIPASAARLADQIEALPNDNLYLVAHSMGGLVTALALDGLKARGLGGNVRRVVTLGTPWLGSYAIPRLFSGLDPSYRPLSFFLGVLDDLRNPTGRHLQASYAVGSWPGLYQLMPFYTTETPYGRVAAGAYVPDRYSGFNPYTRAGWFSRSIDVQGLLSRVTYDPAVWVSCLGVGTLTPQYLPDDADPRVDGNYVTTPSGDGTVPVWSANGGPGPAVIYVNVTHAALAYDPLVLDSIGGLLRNGWGGKQLLTLLR